jgi:hypothetical protein
MTDHVRILAYLRIGFGALGLFGALVVLLIFGGAAGVLGLINPHDADAWRVAIPIIGIVGTAIVTLILLLSIPGLIAGLGLLKLRPWARTLTIVLSVLDLLQFPFGTALGVYGLWVLLKPGNERLFAQRYSATPG